MTPTVAFIDEYGNPSFQFDKNDTSTHFIVVCVLVDAVDFEKTTENLEQIRKNYFQTSEIKSQLVGNNDIRRLKILNQISKLNFRLLALVVDKRKLYGEGFSHKQSFYKFLNGLLYRDLTKVFSDLDIYMDGLGHEKFMTGFIRYLRKQKVPDLFTEQSDIRFQNSKDNLFIQLADFIAGTLARVYDENKTSPYAKNFTAILKKHIGDIIFFPKEYDRYSYEITREDSIVDIRIAELALKKAQDFIDIYQDSEDSTVMLQVRTIKLLRLYRQTIYYSKYISTNEILEHLNYHSREKIKEHFFRTNIIAKLRDNDVLIASSNLGYKLPTCKADLYSFLNHGNSVILPMISRIERFVRYIHLNTGEDILAKDEFKELSKLIDNRNG